MNRPRGRVMKQRGRAIGQPVKGRGHSAVRSKARKTPTAHLSTDHSPEQFDRLKRERDEALEQLSATSEILKIISKSPGELEQVFDAMLEKATRICDAKFATLYLSDGDTWRAVAATRDAPPGYVQARKRNILKLSPGGPLEQVVDTKQVVHIADMKELRPYRERHPTIVAAVELGGFRTCLMVPMLRDDELIGAISILRQEVRPFTDKQIELLQNFAAQAVIAIENTRLLSELRQRTDDLSESLEQQTATSEVLKVISSSPGELEPVFQTMLENATHICEARFGNLVLYENENDAFRMAAMHGAPPEFAEKRGREPIIHPSPKSPLFRVAKTRQLLHIIDLRIDEAYVDGDLPTRAFVELAGTRTIVVVPMLKDDKLIGAIGIYRQEVRPFTDKQIELLKNFAAQAVIAIENTRLLNELRQRTDDLTESLEQQTATSEVLQVISSSPGDLEPVFNAMLGNATRICEAKFGVLFIYEGDAFRVMALHGAPPAYAEERRRDPRIGIPHGTALARIVETRQTVQIADIQSEPVYSNDPQRRAGIIGSAGARTLIMVPMLKDEELIGAIAIFRQEVRPFTDKQIGLVTNFAAQAVIAIENTRLLNELRESLQQQTATADVLKVISTSTSDVVPVFEAILKSASRLCNSEQAVVFRFDGELLHLAATENWPAEALATYAKRYPTQPNPHLTVGRVVLTKNVVIQEDTLADVNYEHAVAQAGGWRRMLGVPMMHDGNVIGVIVLAWKEPGPVLPRYVELLQTFAAQAVIAIENVRLFKELRSRTHELTLSLDDLRNTQDRLVQTTETCSAGATHRRHRARDQEPAQFRQQFRGGLCRDD